jgi:hypothetical protein
MFDGNNDAKRDDERVALASGSGRRRCSAAEKVAVIRETLVLGRVFPTWPGAGRWIHSRSIDGGTARV